MKHFKTYLKQFIKYFTFLLLACIAVGCQPTEEQNEVDSYMEEVRKLHAPDKRVALFDVRLEGNSLLGETNLPAALEDLKTKLQEGGIVFSDEVRVLPDMEENKNFGLVTISVANIRSAPKHSAELATQATLGTPLQVLKKEDTWYLVQTPDRYISWVDAAGIELMDQNRMQQWNQAQKVIFTSLVGYVFADESKKDMVSDLTAGNVMELVKETRDFYEIKLPDGRKGLIEKEYAEPLESWLASRETTSASLISTAKNMMGIPYLWGGTSIKGVDCSGFTKTIFFLNGQVIPRDASQQIHEGEEVDRNKDWENLQVGDLLFFGVPATETAAEKVIHVGMWIGNNEFIHSRGRVRISSFDPQSEHYDEYELNRYLRTKRVVGKESQNILAVEKFIK